MTTALLYLALILVLAVVQVLAASIARSRQNGPQWALSSRDNAPVEYSSTTARLGRAQTNLYETLPLFIGGVLLAHVCGREDGLTAWGAGLFFWGRVFYVPAYVLGLAPWRTLIWGVSLLGLLLVLFSLVR